LPERLLLLLGLAFFLGLAFEEYYGEQAVKPPGGVRTFPLLAFAGAGLYFLEPVWALPFTAGLLAVAIWLFLYYQLKIRDAEVDRSISAGVVVPVANLFAFLLGPLVLWAPIWVGMSFTVVGVLLLGAREPLHAFARRVPKGELTTLGKFLILTGILLPLVPNTPVTTLTTITPYQVWLAVVAVSTISYVSYLAQRYIVPKQGGLLASLLGGLYSSTATTVVLARRLRGAPRDIAELQAGIVLATAIMYLRVGVVVGVFNLALAKALTTVLLPLVAFALVLAGVCYLRHPRERVESDVAAMPENPLEIGTALLFAILFVVISLVSSWVQSTFGRQGLYWLAAILGVSDVDPFVLSVAQGVMINAPISVMSTAILIAASSNNLLKAVYAIVFARGQAGVTPALALFILAITGIGLTVWIIGAI